MTAVTGVTFGNLVVTGRRAQIRIAIHDLSSKMFASPWPLYHAKLPTISCSIQFEQRNSKAWGRVKARIRIRQSQELTGWIRGDPGPGHGRRGGRTEMSKRKIQKFANTTSVHDAGGESGSTAPYSLQAGSVGKDNYWFWGIIKNIQHI